MSAASNVVPMLVVHEQDAIRALVRGLLAGEGFVVDEAAAWDMGSHVPDTAP